MNSHQIFGLVQVIVVIALVVIAAALATPKNKIPLAMRGIFRILRKDGRANAPGSPLQPVPAWKRLLAFILVILAFVLAMIVV